MKVLFAFLIVIVLFLAGVFNYRSSKRIADRMTRLYTGSGGGTEKKEG